jgi:hypothetical protein
MIDALIQSAVLFALVAIVTRLLKRRAPASLRHMLWAFAILGALAAPVIARVSPLEFRLMPDVGTLGRSDVGFASESKTGAAV